MAKVLSRFASLVAQKEIRDNKRYKQHEIALELKVSPSTVSRWLKGDNMQRITLETAAEICEWLECDLPDLIQIEREAS
jgi:DNA-binding Xre family transcriptional regulator